MRSNLRSRTGKDSGLGKRPPKRTPKTKSQPSAARKTLSSILNASLANPLSPATTRSDISSTPEAYHNEWADTSGELLPEIIVCTDDMEMLDMDSSEPEDVPHEETQSQSVTEDEIVPTEELQFPPAVTEEATSLGSSLSVMSDLSELSPVPSSRSSKATTPVDADNLKDNVVTTAPTFFVNDELPAAEDPAVEEQSFDPEEPSNIEDVPSLESEQDPVAEEHLAVAQDHAIEETTIVEADLVLEDEYTVKDHSMVEDQASHEQVAATHEPPTAEAQPLVQGKITPTVKDPPIVDREVETQKPLTVEEQPPPVEEQPSPIEANAAVEEHTPAVKPSSLNEQPSADVHRSTDSQPPVNNRPVAEKASRARRHYNVRPKVSIPVDLSPQDYAMQCVAAAESSRLNPYALHKEEYTLLRQHISHAHVTTYLNIRNGILRLWITNPQVIVRREEAVGCARDAKWFDVASVSYDWLVRRGYINFGCVEVRPSNRTKPQNLAKRKRVAVIGAGMSGLGCARQLEGLFNHFSKRFWELGEEVPEVIVLEGRNRVGGRVYSRPFKTQPEQAAPGFEDKRCTAEMGGMIITGFDRGNPMNILVRGQLHLGYHALLSETTIYDSNGKPVDPVRDLLVENLYNDFLDRVSEYKFKPAASKVIEGNRDLMDDGKDSSSEAVKSISVVEETTAAQPHAPSVAQQNVPSPVSLVPVSSDRVTGRVHMEPGTPGSLKAAFKARLMGWALRPGVHEDRDLDLETPTKAPNATLGSVVDDTIMQYKDLVDLNSQDFRLINWHIANLEYSNAIDYSKLSLQGWDIDAGYEWEGKHTMVVGGYQTVPRGLALLPSPLSLRQRSPVKKIKYSSDGSSQATIVCEDGFTMDADYVVNTIPLGVLKHGNVEFDPPLPSWKSDVIDRLGYGVLNKLVLVYKEAFWDEDRDIFGVLRNPKNRSSLNQRDYSSQRGRMFQWFNVTHTTGMPCLIALMAGEAGFDTEQSCNDDLVEEATQVLRSVFGARVPAPLEFVVTRWASDKFARGSYSSAGPNMHVDDYDQMARPIGNLYFAGEHTIGTHPATVHGAYMSGLRAASELIDKMVGFIEVPEPLIRKKGGRYSLKRKASDDGTKDPRQARLEAYDEEVWQHIVSQLGARPVRPAKPSGSNAYLLFNKANYDNARKRCEEGRRPGKGKPAPNEVRVMTSKMWKEAGPQERKPFEEQAEEQKKSYAEAMVVFTRDAGRWDVRAEELRAKYVEEHPSVPGPEEVVALALATAGAAAAAAAAAAEMERGSSSGGGSAGRRPRSTRASYAESDSDVEMADGV